MLLCFSFIVLSIESNSFWFRRKTIPSSNIKDTKLVVKIAAVCLEEVEFRHFLFPFLKTFDFHTENLPCKNYSKSFLASFLNNFALVTLNIVNI